MSPPAYWSVGVGILLGLAACAEPADEPMALPSPPQSAPSQKVRNGSQTTERPEIGWFGGCTATLVASDVAITAAHCLGYGTRTQQGRYYTFRIDGPEAASYYTVIRYRSFGSRLGTNDIALLELGERVDPRVARPVPLAEANPSSGTDLAVYGYGCTAIGRSGDGRKRRAIFSMGDASYHLCPGDSGGPVFDQSTGAILRINSGYYVDRHYTDIHAHVPTLRADLLTQIRAWTEDELPEVGQPEPPSTEEEPPTNTPDEPRPDPNENRVCGQDVRVFPDWTCASNGAFRHVCRQGSRPIWEDCPDGCHSRPVGQQDYCVGQPNPNLESDPQSEPDPEPIDDPESDGESEVPDPQQPICGEDVAIYSDWTCTTDGGHRYQCLEGRNPQWEPCPNGCLGRPSGQDDICGDAPPEDPETGCGEYDQYTQWVCTTDRHTMLRCRNDRVEARRCASRCRMKWGRARCGLF